MSQTQPGTGAEQIDFAFAIQSGYAEVRENGSYRGDIAVNAGDVLRISVHSGSVNFARNGEVFYTSTAMPSYPLRAYATLFASGSTVADARFAVSVGDDPVADAPLPPPDPENGPVTPAAVQWDTLVNAKLKGSSLIKNGGCDGCADAGALSQQQITEGEGYFEFTVDETTRLRYAGLSSGQKSRVSAPIDFAFRPSVRVCRNPGKRDLPFRHRHPAR